MNRYSTMSAAGNNSPTKRNSAHTRTMSPFEATRRSIAHDSDDTGVAGINGYNNSSFSAQDDGDFLLDSDNEEPKLKCAATTITLYYALQHVLIYTAAPCYLIELRRDSPL
jgi:hypothetical protein